MVEATEDRHRAYWPLAALGIPGWRLWERLAKALVWPRPIEVHDIFAPHAGEVALAEDEQVVQAFRPHAAQEALAGGIRPRRADRSAQDRDAAGRGDAGEGRPEFAVVVADQVAWVLSERGGLAQLLRHPGVGRVACRTHMDDPPRGQLDDEEGEQWAEEEVGDREEVAGPGFCGVAAQEGGPGLPARPRYPVTTQVCLDGALGHEDAELPQLAADPLGPPERVLGRHPSDEGDRLRRQRRATWPRA